MEKIHFAQGTTRNSFLQCVVFKNCNSVPQETWTEYLKGLVLNKESFKCFSKNNYSWSIHKEGVFLFRYSQLLDKESRGQFNVLKVSCSRETISTKVILYSMLVQLYQPTGNIHMYLLFTPTNSSWKTRFLPHCHHNFGFLTPTLNIKQKKPGKALI